MPDHKPFVYVGGELILRVGGEDQSLGMVRVPLVAEYLSSGDLHLVAKTGQIHDYVESVFNNPPEESLDA